MKRGLLDTSVFISAEAGRELRSAELPDQSAVSIITYAELRAGVLAASDVSVRARRLATLEKAMSLEPLPVDVAVAEAWATLRVRLREAGRAMKLNDSWIAATAIALDIPVITQDADFDDAPGLEVVKV